MYQIALTENPKQKMTIVLPAGTSIAFSIEYWESQQGWYYSMSAGTWSVTNRRLVVGYNILRQFRGVIPFGLCVLSDDGYEPVFKTDFSTGRVKVYALNSDDVALAETQIAGYIS